MPPTHRTQLGTPGLHEDSEPRDLTEAETFEQWQEAACAWAEAIHCGTATQVHEATVCENKAWRRLCSSRGTPPRGLLASGLSAAMNEMPEWD